MMVAAKTSSLLVVFFLLGFVHVNCESESNESYLGSNETISDDAPITRISGGTNAHKPYSFVALIISTFTDENGVVTTKRCSGAFIHLGIILTSAFCLRQDPGTITPDKIEVRFEKVFKDKDIDGLTYKCILEFNPTYTLLHPGFDYATRKDDLAIIREDKKIRKYVDPIKIHERYKHEDFNSLYVAGWGRKSESDTEGATHLQFGKVSIITDTECTALKPADISLENKICSKGPARLCTNDEGSPLVSNKLKTQPKELFGIASYSSGCEDDGSKADIYVRISKYYDWIKTESKNKNRW